jgi:hypothetical protein
LFGEPIIGCGTCGSATTNYSDDESSDEPPEESIIQPAELIDLDSLLDSTSSEYELPSHQRCATHSLNLVSTSDADKAEQNAAYKKISRSAFGKCQSLRNKYSRSTLAADAVNDSLGLGLKRLNVTRWNSLYMAVERLVRIVNENGEDQRHSVCTTVGVPRLSAGELLLVSDYASVMKRRRRWK